jgi:hypothetical protein
MSQLSTNARGMLALCESQVLAMISSLKGISMPKQIAKAHRKARHGRRPQHVKPTRGRKRARLNKPAMDVARIAKQQGFEPNAYTGVGEDIVE